MSVSPNLALAQGVLMIHMAIIAFNVVGLIIIPLGGWFGWRFVHRPGWRLIHLASLAVVALQALAGRACVLTIAQDRLTGGASRPGLIMTAVNRLIFWPLPFWMFTVLYVAIVLYVLGLLWWVPLRKSAREVNGPGRPTRRRGL